MNKCSCCGQTVEAKNTTFTMVKNDVVYVVEDVPCFECTSCGHTSFTEDVAKKLEKYISGRVLSTEPRKMAWVFRWNKPLIELPKESIVKTTEYITAFRPVSTVSSGIEISVRV